MPAVSEGNSADAGSPERSALHPHSKIAVMTMSADRRVMCTTSLPVAEDAGASLSWRALYAHLKRPLAGQYLEVAQGHALRVVARA